MIALSTCWNNHRHTDGRAMVREIAEMGFDTVEVSHGLRLPLLPGIQEAVNHGEIRVCGVHNFCPSPVEVVVDAPDCYEFTSDLKLDRERAVSMTLKTLETAADLSAEYVVLHLGSIPMPRITDKLEAFAKSGQVLSKDYVRAKVEAVKERERIAPPYLERAYKALEQIIPEAEKSGIKLGVECRSHYEQCPSEREIEQIFKDFDSPVLGYWHDFGHAQRKANLGFMNHAQWLQRISGKLIGCHIHDVVWPDRDHMIPSEGSMDYETLMPLIPEGVPLVWELSYRRKKKNIIAAAAPWSERFTTSPA